MVKMGTEIGVSMIVSGALVIGAILALGSCEVEAQERRYYGRDLSITYGVPTVPGIERGRRFDRYYDARQGRVTYRRGAAVYDVDPADRPAPCGARFEVLSGAGKGCI